MQTALSPCTTYYDGIIKQERLSEQFGTILNHLNLTFPPEISPVQSLKRFWLKRLFFNENSRQFFWNFSILSFALKLAYELFIIIKLF